MEREARYAAVGAFVILIVTMVAMFVYWYSEGRDRRSYQTYEIYFVGSITGLPEGGSVRYLGVEVGKVRRIRLDRRSADRVQVVVEIDEETPVSETTTAELSSLSLATGLLYVDLKQNNGKREVLPPVPSERYPVITTVRSNFDSFLNSLPELAGNVTILLDRAQEILSPENAKALAGMVKNMHDASAQLPGTIRSAESLMKEIELAGNDVRKLVSNLNHATEELGPSVVQLAERLNTTADNLEKATNGVHLFINENRGAVAGFTSEGLPQMQRAIEEVRGAAAEFRELSRSLKENPSQLIYQPPLRGVEIPR